MGNKTPKLHALAIREIRFAKPSASLIQKANAALSSLSQTLTSVDELQNQADLLHIEAVLVSEGINDNDDAFTREELKRAITSPIMKPMNWQHKDDQILGAMYAVEARDLEGKTLTAEEIKDQPIELVIQGVVWHHLPQIQAIAEQIVQRIQQDDLFVSMECWFDNYDYALYTKAGELYASIARNSDTAFLDGSLRANGGTGVYNTMRIGRALRGISFGGIAFVDRPANKRSFILNHFAFDPTDSLVGIEGSDDSGHSPVVTKTTLFSDKKIPLEVNMNDLNHAAAASNDEIASVVGKAFEARDRVEAQKQTVSDLTSAQARNTELENELKEARSALEKLQAAVDSAYAGATANIPEEIAKIDRALDVKGDAAGDAVYAAKIAWIENSAKAAVDVASKDTNAEADTKLIEENTAMKAELEAIKADLRKREIEFIFAEKLEMDADKVAKFVEVGLSQASDEAYEIWFDEKKVFAKDMLELKKKSKKSDDEKKKTDAADDAEAGLLSPSQRETPIDDLDAVLRGRNGRAPADIARVPRSKVSGASELEDMFDEVIEPNLAGAGTADGNSASPMGSLVASLLEGPKKDKEV